MRIFLSAVSGQFKACRDALASDLRAVGAEVVVQEDFQQHGRSLLEKLEEYIAGCDRVIVLVGNAYGCAPEPEARPTGRPLRSYTQWEYFFSQGERLDKAQVTAKETFVYLASPDFLASHSVEQTKEACTFQEQFVSEMRRSGKDRSQFSSLHELRALVLRDGFHLGERGMTALGAIQRIASAYNTADLAAHWIPKSRGAEFATGFYFFGRSTAIRTLIAWLRAEESDGRMRVVVGGPGSGKSAVLGRLVSLANVDQHAALAEAGELADLDADEILEPGDIDLAIHARGKTLDHLNRIVAAYVGLEVQDITSAASAEAGAALLVEGVRERRHDPFRMVVDALDEAAEAAQIARKLLRPLGALANVRLIVGTRNTLLAALGEQRYDVDLDGDYFDPTDLVGYVERRLKPSSGVGRSPYHDSDIRRRVAEAIAKNAKSSFLYAREVSRRLANRDTPFAIDQERLPVSLGDAFAEEFEERFGKDQAKVRALLMPLAYALGLGLPQESVWESIASALAGEKGKYHNDPDLRWLKEEARFYIVEDSEASSAVYRLFHEELSSYLCEPALEQESQRRITQALIETVSSEENGSTDWLRARPYVRTYLAWHAVRAGVLSDLLGDPLFLVSADATQLLGALNADPRAAFTEAGLTYRFAGYLLKQANYPALRASYLEMAARQLGFTRLADALANLALVRQWSVPWGVWEPVTPHGILAEKCGASSLELCYLNNRSIVVLGGNNGTVEVWDLASGAPVYESLAGHEESVTVAVTDLEGRSVVVSGDKATMRAWDLASGKPVGAPFGADEHEVETLAVGKLAGSTVVVSGGAFRDGSVRVWDLEKGTLVGKPMRGHDWVRALAVSEVKGRPVVVCGGYEPGPNGRQTIRLWDLATGAPVGNPLKLEYNEGITCLATGKLDGRPILVSGQHDRRGWEGTLRVWDLETGALMLGPLPAHGSEVLAVAVGMLGSAPIVVSCGRDELINVWDLRSGTAIGEPMAGHKGGISRVAIGALAGHRVVVSHGFDRTIRIWDLERVAMPVPHIEGHQGGVTCLAVGDRAGRSVVVTGGQDNTVRIWDLESGDPVGNPLVGHEKIFGKDARVMSVAVEQLNGMPIVVSSGMDGTVRVWDLVTGSAIGKPFHGHYTTGSMAVWIGSVAVGDLGGRRVLVAGGYDGTVNVWDLQSGVDVYEPFDPLIGGGRASWPKHGTGTPIDYLALTRLEGRLVVVVKAFGHRVPLRVWDLADRAVVGKEISAEWYGRVAVTNLDGRPVLVWSDSDGVRISDIASGDAIGRPFGPGKTSVTAGELNGRPVVVISRDETLQMWDLRSRIPISEPIYLGVGRFSGVALWANRIVLGGTYGPVCVELAVSRTLSMTGLSAHLTW
jgi:WD40 repeat protein